MVTQNFRTVNLALSGSMHGGPIHHKQHMKQYDRDQTYDRSADRHQQPRQSTIRLLIIARSGSQEFCVRRYNSLQLTGRSITEPENLGFEPWMIMEAYSTVSAPKGCHRLLPGRMLFNCFLRTKLRLIEDKLKWWIFNEATYAPASRQSRRFRMKQTQLFYK